MVSTVHVYLCDVMHLLSVAFTVVCLLFIVTLLMYV